MTTASQGINAGLEHRNRNPGLDSKVYNTPQPPDYMLYTFRDWFWDQPRSGDNLAATHSSRTPLRQKKSASSFPPTSVMHPLHEKRLISGPIQFILKLLDYWHLNRDDAVSLLGFNSTDSNSVKDILNGMTSLDRDVRDRIAHLFHIWTTLSSLFQDRDVENDWLREPHALLDEQSPLNLLMDGDMENLLLVKEYVDAAAGH